MGMSVDHLRLRVAAGPRGLPTVRLAGQLCRHRHHRRFHHRAEAQVPCYQWCWFIAGRRSWAQGWHRWTWIFHWSVFTGTISPEVMRSSDNSRTASVGAQGRSVKAWSSHFLEFFSNPQHLAIRSFESRLRRSAERHPSSSFSTPSCIGTGSNLGLTRSVSRNVQFTERPRRLPSTRRYMATLVSMVNGLQSSSS